MPRLGGLSPSGGAMRGQRNLSEITNAEKARENIQVGGAFDLEFDSTHSIVLPGRTNGGKYRLWIDDTVASAPKLTVEDV